MTDSTFTGLDNASNPVAFKSDLVAGAHTPYRKEDLVQRSALITALGLLGSEAKLEAVRALLAGALTVSGPLTADELTAAALMTNAKGEELRALLAGNLSAIAPPPTSATVVIASGQSLSAAHQVDGKLAGIIMPAAWDAAAVTFLGSVDGSSFSPIYDAGVERSIASADAAVNRMILLPLSDWLGVKHLQLRSGTVALPVNQTAARTITLLKVA